MMITAYAKNMRRSDRWYLLVCIFIILFAIGYKTFDFGQFVNVGTAPLPSRIILEKSEIQSGSSNSRVYSVSDKIGHTFLISADGEMKHSDAYTLNELHVNDFWNPVTCSRVPFIKHGHQIYFLETKKVLRGEQYEFGSVIYVLDVEAQKLYGYEVSGIHTTGYIYKNNETIYIASPVYTKDLLTSIGIYSFDANSGELHLENEVTTHSWSIRQPTFKKFESQLALNYFGQNLMRKSLMFDGTRFKEATLSPEETVRYEGDRYKVYNTVQSNYERKVGLSDFDHLQIIEKETGKTLIELAGDQVNKYAITDL